MDVEAEPKKKRKLRPKGGIRKFTKGKARYLGAFRALACFRGVRQEAFRAWDAGNHEVAWRLLQECRYWWELYEARRREARVSTVDDSTWGDSAW